MGKSKKSLNLLYLIGMALTLIGCFLPLTASKTFGMNGYSAFDSISGNDKVMMVAAILVLIGAIAGVIFCFVAVKGVPMKMISFIIALLGVLYVVFKRLFASDAAKALAKFGNKVAGTKPSIGLICILVGLVLALVGMLMNKDM